MASRWEIAETGRRRKYYRLTDAGRAELEHSREQWSVVHGALERLTVNIDTEDEHV